MIHKQPSLPHHHRHGADADVFGDDDGAGPLVDDDAGLAGQIGKGRAGKEGQRSYGDPYPRSHGTMVHHAKAKDKLRPPEGTFFFWMPKPCVCDEDGGQV